MPSCRELEVLYVNVIIRINLKLVYRCMYFVINAVSQGIAN